MPSRLLIGASARIHYPGSAGKPEFGISRGLQLLNVTYGGTLLQDIPTQCPEALHHRVPGKCEHHDQGIKDLAPDFVAGVQWHPEFHEPSDPVTRDDMAILHDLLAAARQARG